MTEPPSDPASLANLHDIVLPAPVPWWPPAPGWYLIGALALAVLLCSAWRAWRTWRANRYRRAALGEIERLARMARSAETRQEALGSLPALLKRVALAAYGRAEVAALSGDAWLRFLDRSGGTDSFTRGAGRLLPKLAYDPNNGLRVDEDEARGLLAAASEWVRRHRRLDSGDA